MAFTPCKRRATGKHRANPAHTRNSLGTAEAEQLEGIGQTYSPTTGNKNTTLGNHKHTPDRPPTRPPTSTSLSPPLSPHLIPLQMKSNIFTTGQKDLIPFQYMVNRKRRAEAEEPNPSQR